MNETIWQYLEDTIALHSVIQDWHTIAEALEHTISQDEFDDIHTTVTDYINCHSLEGVEVLYDGEPQRRVIDESPRGIEKTA